MPSLQPIPPDPLDRARIPRLLFIIALLGTCGLIMSMNAADPDLWGHVQYGREILLAGGLPRTSTWTFTAEGHRWINHENLSELALALSADAAGSLGLSLGKYLMGLFLIGLTYFMARQRGTRPAILGFVCIVMALALEFHWHFRPQIFGYLLFALAAQLLAWSTTVIGSVHVGPTHRVADTESGTPLPASSETGRELSLLWLLPLFVVWANTHGSYAAGVCIVVAYLGLRLVERLRLADCRRNVRVLGLLAVVPLLVVLSTLVTPYGLELPLWLWDDLVQPRPEIGDWEGIALLNGSRESLCFVIIMLTTLMAVWKDPHRDWVHIALFALIAWQAASHVRHLALLAIAWGCWFPDSLERTWQTFSAGKPANARPAGQLRNDESPASPFPVSLVLAAWIIVVACLTWPRLATLHVSRDKYPVDAFRYMADYRLEGRTVVTFNWAQYAIGFFAAEGLNSTVAVDGRLRTCYPQEVIDIYLDFFLGEDYPGPRYRSPRSGPIDPTKALTHGDPELILISRKQQPSVRVMERHREEWTLLYQDGLSQLWGRRDLYDDPEHPRHLAAELRRVSDDPPLGSRNWPGFPGRDQDVASGLTVLSDVSAKRRDTAHGQDGDLPPRGPHSRQFDHYPPRAE